MSSWKTAKKLIFCQIISFQSQLEESILRGTLRFCKICLHCLKQIGKKGFEFESSRRHKQCWVDLGQGSCDDLPLHLLYQKHHLPSELRLLLLVQNRPAVAKLRLDFVRNQLGEEKVENLLKGHGVWVVECGAGKGDHLGHLSEAKQVQAGQPNRHLTLM